MAPSEKPNQERRFVYWLIAGFGIVLAVLLFFFVKQYQVLRHEAIISARESWLMNAIKNHPHLTANDAGVVRSWMTFDYLNKLFNLSPTYLKIQLSISDPTYPKLTINKFAKDINRSVSETLTVVQNAVRQYLANPIPINTSST
jgi:hypothetical protein